MSQSNEFFKGIRCLIFNSGRDKFLPLYFLYNLKHYFKGCDIVFEHYKKYNLRKVVYIKHDLVEGITEIVPRLPSDNGWIEVDLSIKDYLNDYKEYLKLHGYKIVYFKTKKVPTFGTRILLVIERFLLLIKGE